MSEEVISKNFIENIIDKDLAEGKYHLPWEDDMQIKDGTIYGYPTTGGRFGTEPYDDPHNIHSYKG